MAMVERLGMFWATGGDFEFEERGIDQRVLGQLQ